MRQGVRYGFLNEQFCVESDSVKSRISASVAVRNFSELMNRVRYRGESFTVIRGGKPICEISPAQPSNFTVADLANLLAQLPKPDKEYLDTIDDLLKKQPAVAESKWPS